jgi:predicted RNA-binding Zn ribbon-like protein
MDLELAGNALCLDFTNTVNVRPVPVRDYVSSYPDLLAWTEHAGGLPSSVVRGLRRAEGGEAVLGRALALRDTVYAVFAAIAGKQAPPARDLGILSEAYTDALAHAVLRGDGSAGYHLDWNPADLGRAEAPLWPVARSAGDLLLSGPLERIGQCPSCGWLFLDTSRNGTRRWCNMAVCGSRDKMARYRSRA